VNDVKKVRCKYINRGLIKVTHISDPEDYSTGPLREKAFKKALALAKILGLL